MQETQLGFEETASQGLFSIIYIMRLSGVTAIVFRVNHPGALGGDGMTQFGRALHALNIDIICANSIGKRVTCRRLS